MSSSVRYLDLNNSLVLLSEIKDITEIMVSDSEGECFFICKPLASTEHWLFSTKTHELSNYHSLGYNCYIHQLIEDGFIITRADNKMRVVTDVMSLDEVSSHENLYAEDDDGDIMKVYYAGHRMFYLATAVNLFYGFTGEIKDYCVFLNRIGLLISERVK